MATALTTTRMLAAAVVALFLAGCSISNQGSGASPARLASPSPTPVNSADTKAADLRTRLNLLLAEHVMIVVKHSAAAANRSEEQPGYASLLSTNGSALVDAVGSALGNSAATQFKQAWDIQNGYFVEYTIGLVTHNDAKANGAMSGLINGFVPQLSQLVTSTTQLPLDPMTQLETQHVLDVKAVIDDQIAQNYAQMYVDLRTAYARSERIGDALAVRIAQKFPDKFPGDPSTKAVDWRVSLNDLFQEHAYLATMATDAVVGGRGTERAAAAKAMAANADALGTVFGDLFGNAVGTQFDQVWAAKNAALLAYATTGAADATRALKDTFAAQFVALVPAAGGLANATASQVTATIKVIDDQRSKASALVANDDRTAGSSMEALADPIVDASAAAKP